MSDDDLVCDAHMTLAELQKLIHNTLAYPYAWEKVGLGRLTVAQVADYSRDRSAHLAQELWDVLHDSGIDERDVFDPHGVALAVAAETAQSNSDFGKRLRAEEVVGVERDDSGEEVVEGGPQAPQEGRVDEAVR